MTLRGDTIEFTATPIASTAQRPSLKDDLTVVWFALSSRWKLILAVLILALCGGIAVMWTVAPTYKSSVDILVDPRARNLVGMDVVPAGLGSSSFGSDSALVDSQLQLVQSRAVLGQVVQTLHLDIEAPKSTSVASSIASLAKLLLTGPEKSGAGADSPLDRAIAGLQGAVKVERIGNTYVMRVTVAARSADAAADIANAIAGTYIAQGQDAINRETRQTADALEDRLAQLKSASDAAQQALVDYRAVNGLIDAQGLPVDEQQLRDLNDQATQARIAAASAQARYDEIERLKGLPASQIAASNSLSSPTADALRGDLNTAIAEEISLSGLYGPQHPTLVQAKKRRAALEQALMQEFRRIETRASSDLKTAQNASTALDALLKQAEARRVTTGTASIRLNELQTAADNAKSIYDAFALRAAQTREQIDLPTSTARIIAPADPSATPSDPKLTVVLGVAVAVGLAFGTGLAWLLHLLFGTTDRPRRTAAQRKPADRQPAPPSAAPRKAQFTPAIVVAATHNEPAPAPTRRRPLSGLFR